MSLKSHADSKPHIEPNLKSTFDVGIEIPEDQVALSNMPEKETKQGYSPGRKVVVFDLTPVMSTYLLAWAFGSYFYVILTTLVQVFRPQGLLWEPSHLEKILGRGNTDSKICAR